MKAVLFMPEKSIVAIVELCYRSYTQISFNILEVLTENSNTGFVDFRETKIGYEVKWYSDEETKWDKNNIYPIDKFHIHKIIEKLFKEI